MTSAPMMKTVIAATLLALLAACQSTPRPEDDPRYARLATVVDVHEFTELERQQARANTPSDTRVGVGVGLGTGSYGSFGGISLGMSTLVRKRPPQIGEGANRITVQPIGSTERIEVMSLGNYKAGDCVKVLADHPTEYPRFLELKPGEHCD